MEIEGGVNQEGKKKEEEFDQKFFSVHDAENISHSIIFSNVYLNNDMWKLRFVNCF